MTPDEIRAAFGAFADRLAAGGFARPEHGWPAELVAAHVVLNNDEFSRVAEAVARGEPTAYDNAAAQDDAGLRACAERAGSPAGLAEAVRRSADRLAAARAALTPEQARMAVHLTIRHDGGVVHDEPGPLGEWIDGNASFHLRAHTEQLEALRRGTAAR